tara:strand:- start:103 stop:756 length:654 start_codon:yes stop_codon:yes gene_type:complete
MTRFSIIVPHYDGVISDKMFIEGMDSLENSTFKDFEVLIYHDGPVNRPIPELSGYTFNYKVKETKTRYNNWGHSLRDLGIREATGDYIIHFNPDNILYADALFNIDKSISRINELAGGEVDIVLCPIHMEGMVRVNSDVNNGISLFRTNDKRDILVMDAYPPIVQNIDCMQLVGKRSMWLSKGGWYNKDEISDGLIYQELCRNYSYTSCCSVIGLHR